MDCFKGYLNLFKDLSKLFGYKTTRLNYYIGVLLLLNWFVFVLGFHIHISLSYITVTFLHTVIHTRSSLCIHTHFISFGRLHLLQRSPHSRSPIVLIWSGQFWFVLLVCDIDIVTHYAMFRYCSILSILYVVSQSVSQSVT